MSVVRSMFPDVTVPEPTDFFFPRWHSNPLFRGSYSNWPPSYYIEHLDNLRANVGRLYFAGEATSRKYFGAFHLTREGDRYLTALIDELQDSCMAPTLKDCTWVKQ